MSIPQDLIPEILSHLSRLPVKSLVRLQCVSNSWFALINEQRFIKMHLQTNSERTVLVQTWGCKADRPLNYYLVNLSDESRPVKIFPPFYNPDRFSKIVGWLQWLGLHTHLWWWNCDLEPINQKVQEIALSTNGKRWSPAQFWMHVQIQFCIRVWPHWPGQRRLQGFEDYGMLWKQEWTACMGLWS
jgi:hypothetical protein